MTGTASTRATLRRSDHSARLNTDGFSPGAYAGPLAALSAALAERLSVPTLTVSEVVAGCSLAASFAAFSAALWAAFASLAACFEDFCFVEVCCAASWAAFDEAAGVRRLENIWPPGGRSRSSDTTVPSRR